METGGGTKGKDDYFACLFVFFKTSTDAQSKSVVGGQKDREGWHENYSGQECPIGLKS